MVTFICDHIQTMIFQFFIIFICSLIVWTHGSIKQRNSQQDCSENDMNENSWLDPAQSETRRQNVPGFCTKPSHYFLPKYSRRISEEKCYEYIWKVSYEAFKAKKTEECKKYSPSSRYFETELVTTFDNPHLGGLGWKTDYNEWTFLCGSTLISPKFLVTAGYCSSIKRDYLISDKPHIVSLIDDDLLEFDENSKRYLIQTILVHPKYDPSTQYYDIALVKLKESVEFTVGLQPACLWSYDYIGQLYDELQTVGWGGDFVDELKLRASTVQLVDNTQCKDISDEQFCLDYYATRRLGSNTNIMGPNNCQANTGGPLQLKIPLTNTTHGKMAFLVGVISNFDSCLDTNPRAHTKVSSFIDWIERIVWPTPVLPKAEEKADLLLLPKPFDKEQTIHLEIESTASNGFSISLIVDHNGVDYNNVVFKLSVDFPNNLFTFETIKDGFVEGLDSEGYLPTDVFTNNVVDVSINMRKEFEDESIMDIRINRGRNILSIIPFHELSSIRYIEVKGEDTYVKNFEIIFR